MVTGAGGSTGGGAAGAAEGSRTRFVFSPGVTGSGLASSDGSSTCAGIAGSRVGMTGGAGRGTDAAGAGLGAVKVASNFSMSDWKVSVRARRPSSRVLMSAFTSPGASAAPRTGAAGDAAAIIADDPGSGGCGMDGSVQGVGFSGSGAPVPLYGNS